MGGRGATSWNKSGGSMTVGAARREFTSVVREMPFRKVLEDEFGKLNSEAIILTDTQRKHIAENHPDDLKLLIRNGKSIFKNPDAIVKDRKNDKTVFYIKTLSEGGVRAVVRLSIGTADEDKDNSIITFHRASNKTVKRLLTNNKVLYKKQGTDYN